MTDHTLARDADVIATVDLAIGRKRAGSVGTTLVEAQALLSIAPCIAA